MDRMLLNGSGCTDHTAHEAIKNVEKESKVKRGSRDEAAEVLVRSIKDLMWLSGFRLTDRIRFEDPKSGKQYLRGDNLAEIILFPTHKDYCGRCVYSGMFGECLNEKYHKHQYAVNCVWKYCPYRKEQTGWKESLLKSKKE